MIPALRLSLSLVASLLLWLPTVPAALRANEEPAIIAAYYLAALLVSRIGMGLLFRIVTAYAPSDEESEDHADVSDDGGEGPEHMGPTQAPPADRRRDDPEPTVDDATDETRLDEALDEAADATAMVS